MEVCSYTNSPVALKALDSKGCRSRLIWDCSKITSLFGERVTMSWIFGYVGISGNEFVEMLANKASAANPRDP